MKITNIICAIMLAAAPVSLTGCGLVGAGVDKYDTLVSDDEAANGKWSDYESQLERRSDLIPNIVAVVKGSAAHEKDTLEAVVQARASATQIKLNADDLTDPKKVEAFKAAQSGLTGALSKLMSIQENYPTLQANAAFHDLMIEMEGTENRILVARRDYNSTVQAYNTELRHVSGQALMVVIGNKTFKPRVYFQADESAKVAPKVSFDSPAPATSK
jgi:LemA protein